MESEEEVLMADKKNHKIGIKTLISLILVISIAFSATSCFEEEKPKPYKASDGKKTEVDKLNGGGKKDILKIEERFFITCCRTKLPQRMYFCLSGRSYSLL